MRRRAMIQRLMAAVLAVAGVGFVQGQTGPAPTTVPTGAAATQVVHAPEGYIVGADMSYVQQRIDSGTTYSDKGVVKDVFEILKDHGFNYIRFRVFNDPAKPNRGNMRAYSAQGYCDLPHTITMAKHVKELGFRLLVDFHYSDGWADPGKQYAPAAWVGQTPEQAAKSLHDWTKDAIEQFKKAGAQPDMVQVGNEITPGMMTDLGGTTGNWPVLASYLKAGIAGVHEVDPKIQIMLHIDRGGDRTFTGTLGAANRTARAWVDNALANGVQFDVLGLSCYSQWQGPPAGWKANFLDLAERYPKLKFVMAEVDAQAMEANDVMMSLPEGRGLGTFIWEPTANNANQGLFQQAALGRGGRGGRGVVVPATAATMTASTQTAPATVAATATGPRPAVAVLPDRMAAYDAVIEKYGIKKLP